MPKSVYTQDSYDFRLFISRIWINCALQKTLSKAVLKTAEKALKLIKDILKGPLLIWSIR